MALSDLIQPKPKTMIGRRVMFSLEFDAEDSVFVKGRVKFRFMAADRTENEGKSLPIQDMGFTAQERTDIEAIFTARIAAMLADTSLTVDPTEGR